MRRSFFQLGVALWVFALGCAWVAVAEAARPVYDQYPSIKDGPPPPPGEGEGDDEEEVLIRARPQPNDSHVALATPRPARAERGPVDWIGQILEQLGLRF